jgi:diguanylate cyclase (GGDEF)-like protein
MKLNLQSRFLVLISLIFLLGGAAGYRFFVWYNDEVVSVLGQRFAERNVLYEKSKILGIVTREVTLSQKMASSPVLLAWVADEKNPEARRRAIAEMEDFRGFFRSRSYFFALAQSGNYYYNDEQGGHALDTPRYTLDRNLRKDGWFYVTLDNVKDTQLNVDTDRHLGLTKVWINSVVRDAQGRAVAVTGSGVDLSDFIRSVVSSELGGSANVLIDRHGAIQAHQDVSMIDFASLRKATGNEVQSTVFDLLERREDKDALRQAMSSLVAGKSEVETLELRVQGRRQLTGLVWVPQIQWFVLTMTHPEVVTSSSALPAALILLAGALLLVLLVAAFFLERTVVRRLARLDGAAKALADGERLPALLDKSPDEIGRLTRNFETMAEHIASNTEALESQVAERTAELEKMAHTDFLTELLNRRGMLSHMASEQNRLSRSGGQMAVLIIDIDLFKRINDTWGHAVGDQALSAVASILREAIRTYDSVARWGGEEFLIALYDLKTHDELEAIANKLLAAVRLAQIECTSTTIQLTYSIGGVLADAHASLDEMIKQADDALYRAKNEGRDRAVLGLLKVD